MFVKRSNFRKSGEALKQLYHPFEKKKNSVIHKDLWQELYFFPPLQEFLQMFNFQISQIPSTERIVVNYPFNLCKILKSQPVVIQHTNYNIIISSNTLNEGYSKKGGQNYLLFLEQNAHGRDANVKLHVL